ncbi:MAG: hypothetical protein JST24_02670 [Acidobacteria bacterium]|nr:hypothetical protein [Acidobacteriota bacterium]
MTVKRTPGIPKEPCKPAAPGEASTGARLEALQNIFLSPPKFVVGTTASEAAYRVMVGTKGGLSAFWADAIAGFDQDLEALVGGKCHHPRGQVFVFRITGPLGGVLRTGFFRQQDAAIHVPEGQLPGSGGFSDHPPSNRVDGSAILHRTQ